MILRHNILFAAAFALVTSSGASAQTAAVERVQKNVLTLSGARAVAAAAEAEARRLNTTGAIAVVDDGGNLLYLLRLDNTFPAGASVATGKARTAATFRMPTRNLETAVKNGRTSLVAVGEMTPLVGGVPIVIDGEVVGAVGVSGAASAAQDDELATAAADAVSNGGPVVTYIPASDVRAAFEKGAVLLQNGSYQIHASRRDAPGQAEVHHLETDVIHVLDGATTFVTGGTVRDPVTTAPHEIRGSAIDGGQEYRLTKGDVIVVPRGTPHWFKEVAGPVLYYVVKVQ